MSAGTPPASTWAGGRAGARVRRSSRFIATAYPSGSGIQLRVHTGSGHSGVAAPDRDEPFRDRLSRLLGQLPAGSSWERGGAEFDGGLESPDPAEIEQVGSEGHLAPPAYGHVCGRVSRRSAVGQRGVVDRVLFPGCPVEQGGAHGKQRLSRGGGSLGEENHPVSPCDGLVDKVEHPHRIAAYLTIQPHGSEELGERSQHRPSPHLALGDEHSVEAGVEQNDVDVAEVIGHQEIGSRSEERRVGKECRYRGARYDEKKKQKIKR